MAKSKIGIIGVGWVGGQLKRYFDEVKGYKLGADLHLDDVNPDRRAGDISKADIIFITVPTPRNSKDGSCDVSIVYDAVARIKGRKIIVIRSTVAPGTTAALQKKYPQHKFLFNPEFLTESRAWEDMLHPDRQIVGFASKKNKEAARLVISLLPSALFMSPGNYGDKELAIGATEAEIIKYAGNVFLSRKVNFANALAKAAEVLDADYEQVRIGFGADKRIGPSHLDVYHGGYRGFGGYCFPKDLDGFLGFARDKKLKDVAALLQADRDFNEQLLRDQGLTLEEVSGHIDQVEKLLKTRWRSGKL